VVIEKEREEEVREPEVININNPRDLEVIN
jgi:hypothetical protein